LKGVERCDKLIGVPKIDGAVRQAIGAVFTLIS
jgi:hypothetical protein